uniref:Pco117429 n=1 Tax=Arundo donax TaxID=35708 RepID=A0A0A9BRE3_ARUDO
MSRSARLRLKSSRMTTRMTATCSASAGMV